MRVTSASSWRAWRPGAPRLGREGDRRFGERAWQNNWLLRRMMQSYLATCDTVDRLISDAELDWRTERQARFAASNVLDALARRDRFASHPG